MATSSPSRVAEWIRSEGGYVHEGLDLFAETATGISRRVVAKTEINRNEELLLIPEKCTLYLLEGKADETAEMPLAEMELSPFLLTVLFVLREMAKGNASEFASYFRTLPEKAPPSLLTWSSETRALLKGTSLERNVDGQLFEETFHNQLLPFMQQFSHLWPTEIQTFEKASYVASIVQSRVFHMKEENWVTNKVHEGTTLYLIPLIDMVNHSPNNQGVNTTLIKCKETLKAKLENGEIREVNGYFTMRAERAIHEGEEVLHSYGDLSDAALLRIYGFVPRSELPNLSNFVDISYDLIQSTIDDVAEKQQWRVEEREAKESFLSKHLLSGMEPIAQVEFHVVTEALLPAKLLTIVQVMMLPKEEFQELQKECDSESLPNEAHEEQGEPFELGAEYLDDSLWTELVLLVVLEVIRRRRERVKACLDRCRSTSSSGVSPVCGEMAEAVAEGEEQILVGMWKEAVRLMKHHCP